MVVCGGVQVVAACRVCDAIPCVGIASLNGGGGALCVIDGEVQGVNLCATVLVGVRKEVVTTFCVDVSVPNVRLAGCRGQGAVLRVVHGEMQRYGAVAAVDGLELLRVVSGNNVGLSIPTIFVTCRCL